MYRRNGAAGGEGSVKKKIIIRKIDVDIIISHRRPKHRASPGFPQEKPQGDDRGWGAAGGG